MCPFPIPQTLPGVRKQRLLNRAHEASYSLNHLSQAGGHLMGRFSIHRKALIPRILSSAAADPISPQIPSKPSAIYLDNTREDRRMKLYALP